MSCDLWFVGQHLGAVRPLEVTVGKARFRVDADDIGVVVTVHDTSRRHALDVEWQGLGKTARVDESQFELLGAVGYGVTT